MDDLYLSNFTHLQLLKYLGVFQVTHFLAIVVYVFRWGRNSGNNENKLNSLRYMI
jgi:hypothetical protein